MLKELRLKAKLESVKINYTLFITCSLIDKKMVVLRPLDRDRPGPVVYLLYLQDIFNFRLSFGELLKKKVLHKKMTRVTFFPDPTVLSSQI